MAIAVTHISAATAAIVWALIEWKKFGKPSLVGAVTGIIAGLATITPASGFVGPGAALIIGAAAGIVCFYAVGFVKNRLNIDDSLDVFAVHGVGGILGTLLLAPLATSQAEGMTWLNPAWCSGYWCCCGSCLVYCVLICDNYGCTFCCWIACVRRRRDIWS